MGFVFVPGMGTRSQNVRAIQTEINAAFGPNTSVERNRHTHVFDYRGTRNLKNVARLFRDLWTPRAFPTRRFQSLVALLDAYVRRGEETYVYGVSHGGLLIHRALQVLGRRYPGRTLPFRVVTGGSVRLIPQQTRTYRVLSALNVLNDTDPIWRVFHRALYRRRASWTRDRVHTLRDKRGHAVQLWIRTVRDPEVRASGIDSHTAYFSFDGPERHPYINAELIDPNAESRASPRGALVPVPSPRRASSARNSPSRPRNAWSSQGSNPTPRASNAGSVASASNRRSPSPTSVLPSSPGGSNAGSVAPKRTSRPPSFAHPRRVRSAPSHASSSAANRPSRTVASAGSTRPRTPPFGRPTTLRSHPLLEHPIPEPLRRAKRRDPHVRTIPAFHPNDTTYDVPRLAGKRKRDHGSPAPSQAPRYASTVVRTPKGSLRVRYVRKPPTNGSKRPRRSA